MTKDDTLFTFDPVPLSRADVTEAIGQLQETIKTALSIPPEEFPNDKEIRLTLGFKVIVVPDVNVHITRK